MSRRAKTEDRSLGEHALYVLDASEAHVPMHKALAGLGADKRGVRPPGCPHTAWQLLEHMRLTQRDILRYCVDPKHKSPEFPDGYWPATEAPPDAAAWNASVKAFLGDHKAMRKLVSDPKADLLAPIPHARNVTLLEEAILLGNHNSYHTGQLVLLRRLLAAW